MGPASAVLQLLLIPLRALIQGPLSLSHSYPGKILFVIYIAPTHSQRPEAECKWRKHELYTGKHGFMFCNPLDRAVECCECESLQLLSGENGSGSYRTVRMAGYHAEYVSGCKQD